MVFSLIQVRFPCVLYHPQGSFCFLYALFLCKSTEARDHAKYRYAYFRENILAAFHRFQNLGIP